MAKTTNKIEKPAWLKMTEKELVETIKKLSEEGKQPAQIGLILRDQYGVPTTKIYGKKLSQYLKDLGLESNTELRNAEKKVEKIKEHLKDNITDRKAKHKLQKAQTRLNIVRRYFSRKKFQ
jgi:small subunit ribosomal protein S15